MEIGCGMDWEGGGRLGGTLRDFTDLVLEWKSDIADISGFSLNAPTTIYRQQKRQSGHDPAVIGGDFL